MRDQDLCSWLAEATSRTRDKLNSAHSLIMLTLRLLWYMRTACVFDNGIPVVSDLVDRILNEVEELGTGHTWDYWDT
jgi:hypothetical protein